MQLVLPAGAAKLLGKLTEFKTKYAEARSAQHPELKDTYSSKIASMQAAGGWTASGITLLCRLAFLLLFDLALQSPGAMLMLCLQCWGVEMRLIVAEWPAGVMTAL
jgi:hypothetical protein